MEISTGFENGGRSSPREIEVYFWRIKILSREGDTRMGIFFND
jgi:hypothetical protein